MPDSASQTVLSEADEKAISQVVDTFLLSARKGNTFKKDAIAPVLVSFGEPICPGLVSHH